MKAKIFIPGSIPSQKNSNHAYPNRRTGKCVIVPDAEVVKWKKSVSEVLSASLPRFNGAVSITFLFTHKTRVRKDLDNAVSTLLDTLVAAKIIPDDKCLIVQKMNIELVGFDSKNFGVEIIIENIENPLT